MFWVAVNTILTNMKAQSYIKTFLYEKCTCLGKKKRKLFLEAHHKILQHSVPYSEFHKCFVIINMNEEKGVHPLLGMCVLFN